MAREAFAVVSRNRSALSSMLRLHSEREIEQQLRKVVVPQMPDRAEVKIGQKSEETRERILNAALTLFRERGFESATMRDIARAGRCRHRSRRTTTSHPRMPSSWTSTDVPARRCNRRSRSALENANGLERRLRELIRVKLGALFAQQERSARSAAQWRRPKASPVALQPADEGDPGHRHCLVPPHLGRLRRANSAGA